MGWGARRGERLTSPGRELTLPTAVQLDAKVLVILIPVPDQQLTAGPDHLAGSLEDLPMILEGHQVLLLVIPVTVHIPGVEAGKGKEPSGDECPPLSDHAQLLAFRLCGRPSCGPSVHTFDQAI